ncbi:MAG: helix-turn-helix domain-containing protein [Rhodospirillaceae bacterium]|nr:helix-turn-helix domain-containing protein [Rhodospirillaceae bacterium]
MLQTALTRSAVTAWSPALNTPQSRKNPFDALDTQGMRVTVKRGQELYAEGDDAAYCYKLLTGSLRLVKLMSDGQRQICEFLISGDLLGFESQDEHYFSAEAVTDAVLMRYPRRNAERLINEDPTAARFMRSLTSSNLQGAYERMVLLCHKSAQERIAWFLLEMADRSKTGGGTCVELPMTRSDIADYLGMVIETVSRVLTQLRQKGVIAMKSVNSILLIDRDSLEDIASAA